MTAAPSPRLLTAAEAAAYLAVSKRTLQRLDVPYVAIRSMRRYDPQDLAAWLDAQKVTKSTSPAGEGESASPTGARGTLTTRAAEILAKFRAGPRRRSRGLFPVGRAE